MQNQVWDSQKTENLTKIDLETEFINGFSNFLMLRKAPIALSDLVSEPLPFNLEKPLELRGTFLELFFLLVCKFHHYRNHVQRLAHVV